MPKEDIVVTQSHRVAAVALGKQLLNQNGLIYDDTNIDRLLMDRYLSQKIRRAGGRTHNHKKRSTKDDIGFERSFRNLCQTVLGV